MFNLHSWNFEKENTWKIRFSTCKRDWILAHVWNRWRPTFPTNLKLIRPEIPDDSFEFEEFSRSNFMDEKAQEHALSGHSFIQTTHDCHTTN